MRQKLNMLLIMISAKLRNSAYDFKKDEQGLEVVQVVLIVLIGVLLIAALWAVLSGWLQELWAQITDAGDSITPVSF